MDSENSQIIHCPEDDEYRVFCNICDKLFIERYYENRLKSATHLNNFYKKQRSIKIYQICVTTVSYVIKQ